MARYDTPLLNIINEDAQTLAEQPYNKPLRDWYMKLAREYEVVETVTSRDVKLDIEAILKVSDQLRYEHILDQAVAEALHQ